MEQPDNNKIKVTNENVFAFSARDQQLPTKMIIFLVTVHNNDASLSKSVNAFVDSEGSCSYNTETLAKELKLKETSGELHLGTMNEEKTLRCKRIEGASVSRIRNSNFHPYTQIKECP